MSTLSNAYRILHAALFEDLLLKFACLCLAALTWFYIDGELSDQRSFEVAMRPADISLPAGWKIAPDVALPKFLVRVRGSRRRLQLMSAESISFRKVLIEKPHAGRNLVSVEPGGLVAPGVDVVSVATADGKPSVVELIANEALTPQPDAVQ